MKCSDILVTMSSSLTNCVYRRKKAVKELIMRQAHSLESWQVFGLSSLHIPEEWIEEAQVSLILPSSLLGK